MQKKQYKKKSPKRLLIDSFSCKARKIYYLTVTTNIYLFILLFSMLHNKPFKRVIFN